MKKRVSIIIVTIMLLSNYAYSQNEDCKIKFLDNVEWQEVIKIATKANKPIYIYNYTTW